MIDPATGRPIAAGDFVPTAERFGLIQNLDHWVVARALEMAAAGRRVSANISAASIGDRDLTSRIESGLQTSGADPRLITFEITETAATPAIESLRDFTTRVEAIGCGLSLDDVGTGFGSLTYLRHLPFTELKIDMQFVRGMLESNADARIVESLVVIAKGLGMTHRRRGRRDAGPDRAAAGARGRLRPGLPLRASRPDRRAGLDRAPPQGRIVAVAYSYGEPEPGGD